MVDIRNFRKVNGLTQDALGEYLGVKKSYLSRVENGKEKLATAKFRKLLENPYGWDASMLTETKETSSENEGSVLNGHIIRVIPVAARAGSLSDFTQGVMARDCEMGISPIAGADYIIPVCGESMAPEYPNGSRVIVKKIDDAAFLEWGRVYCLDTRNGAVIKELHKCEDPSAVECVSLNPDPKYASFQVRREDILGVYRVLMCMALK